MESKNDNKILPIKGICVENVFQTQQENRKEIFNHKFARMIVHLEENIDWRNPHNHLI